MKILNSCCIPKAGLHITVLGGVRLSGLDRLKVMLKLTLKEKSNGAAFRHHLDLYNNIQCEQLIEKASEVLDLSSIELSAVISHLITALENYRGASGRHEAQTGGTFANSSWYGVG